MTFTISLTDEQAARLHEKAQRQNKEDWEYLRDVALQETEPNEWVRQLQSIGIHTGVSLSDEATSRESLYEDHD